MHSQRDVYPVLIRATESYYNKISVTFVRSFVLRFERNLAYYYSEGNTKVSFEGNK